VAHLTDIIGIFYHIREKSQYSAVSFDQATTPQPMVSVRPVPVELAAIRPVEGERDHLLIQENTPPDMTGYVLCAACVFFLANPLFGALAFILAGTYSLLTYKKPILLSLGQPTALPHSRLSIVISDCCISSCFRDNGS